MIKAVTKQILKKESEDGQLRRGGDIFGFCVLAFTEHDLTKAVVRLTKSLVRRDSSFVTLLFGEDVIEEEAEAVYRAVSAKMPEDVEVALINGGQPVYYFVISVE